MSFFTNPKSPKKGVPNPTLRKPSHSVTPLWLSTCSAISQQRSSTNFPLLGSVCISGSDGTGSGRCHTATQVYSGRYVVLGHGIGCMGMSPSHSAQESAQKMACSAAAATQMCTSASSPSGLHFPPKKRAPMYRSLHMRSRGTGGHLVNITSGGLFGCGLGSVDQIQSSLKNSYLRHT